MPRKPPALGFLGEFCALGESFKFLAEAKGNAKARVLGEAVEAATQGVLDTTAARSRKVGQPDNRDSHYWFARYWAEALAAQTGDADLAAHFAPIAKALAEKETRSRRNWRPCGASRRTPAATTTPIRLTAGDHAPSVTLNAIIDG
jgi:isocitrate dehydrogenase